MKNKIFSGILIYFIFILNPVWCIGFDNQTQSKVKIKLSSETVWNNKAGAETIIDLQLTNLVDENYTGELRLLILVLNGRIDFNAVTITVLDKPESVTTDKKYSGFFVKKAIKLLANSNQSWRFKMILPAGSRKPNMALQLFSLYRDKYILARKSLYIH
ncbi:hypothetical protein [Candidatus Marithrix sp. Canyon 246]|uniref:hypothetical protein n=1 Tax=Candidatus Marithrix sp. Canyon 246 TaxID=1827136 RepID=UPI00084A0DEF|nr:hypothetical protein [Candidatus Marithrix sp. Canyon 246]